MFFRGVRLAAAVLAALALGAFVAEGLRALVLAAGFLVAVVFFVARAAEVDFEGFLGAVVAAGLVAVRPVVFLAEVRGEVVFGLVLVLAFVVRVVAFFPDAVDLLRCVRVDDLLVLEAVDRRVAGFFSDVDEVRFLAVDWDFAVGLGD